MKKEISCECQFDQGMCKAHFFGSRMSEIVMIASTADILTYLKLYWWERSQSEPDPRTRDHSIVAYESACVALDAYMKQSSWKDGDDYARFGQQEMVEKALYTVPRKEKETDQETADEAALRG